MALSTHILHVNMTVLNILFIDGFAFANLYTLVSKVCSLQLGFVRHVCDALHETKTGVHREHEHNDLLLGGALGLRLGGGASLLGQSHEHVCFFIMV